MLVFLKLECRLSFCCGRFGSFCSALELLTRLQRLLVVWKLLVLSFVGGDVATCPLNIDMKGSASSTQKKERFLAACVHAQTWYAVVRNPSTALGRTRWCMLCPLKDLETEFSMSGMLSIIISMQFIVNFMLLCH
jgi:hypothetical protein